MSGKNKTLIFGLMIVFSAMMIFILSVNAVSAAGCCFNSGTGACNENSEENSCVNYGGYYSSGNCDSLSECSSGCCVLGSATKLTGYEECNFLSKNLGMGFTDNFKDGANATECNALKNMQDYGACVKEI